MKPKKTPILLAIILALTPFLPAQAQILSGAKTITADTDVLNTGTTILAWSYNGGSTPTPVNGVTFSANTTQNGVGFSILDSPLGYPGAGVGGGLSPALTAVLYNIVYNFNDPFSLQLTGLTSGKVYTAQLLCGDSGTSRPGSELITDNSNGTDAMATLAVPTSDTCASYILDTFTANSSGTETITLSGTGASGTFPVFDAINLRTAPEPSTWALLASGLIVLIYAGRRRLTA